MGPLAKRGVLAGSFGGFIGLLAGLTGVPFYFALPIGLILGMAIGRIPDTSSSSIQSDTPLPERDDPSE